ILAGPWSGQVLADLGADVVKVEDTGLGDFCRHEHPQLGGMSYYHEALARNKRSVALNLKDARALEAYLKLVETADVVVESFRPGVTRKLGIDYDTMREGNPRLVYCSLSGYGQDDPRSLRALHDLNMQAQSGYLSLNGGVKAPLHLCDLASSMVAAQSILAALYDREVSGEGRRIDISMFDSFVWWNSLLDARWCFQGGTLDERSVIYPADCCFYNIFETADGSRLSLGLIEDKFWRAFCEDVGAPELAEKPEGAYGRVCELVASKTLAEWVAWIAERDLPIAPVIDKGAAIGQMLECEPDMMAYCDFPRAGRVLQTNLPHRIAGMRPSISDFEEAPALGEHTQAVLRELGWSEAEIMELVESGGALVAGKGAS
ncbi:MAG: CaiB/BaiF CoA-transferase family protein, partial [Gordonibacter sp.]|uniref:CaiB/BaiF CoA transferase family protein n=1 Tax=Gordonibacter sp. TaxID=1968902 RepID=UPI002FCC61AA